MDCASETKTCYMIDHNAYIVLSINRSEVGRPLSAVDRNVLQRLLDIKMYREIVITDNQALEIVSTEISYGALGGSASALDMVSIFLVTEPILNFPPSRCP